jgi:hypothetical protein
MDLHGPNVNRAKSLGIAVKNEEDFFAEYEIDDDIKANLQ